MKYAWDTKRFPDFLDGDELIGFSHLYDTNNNLLGPYIVAFDEDTGEIWEQVRDTNNEPVVVDGKVLVINSVHPAPLRWEKITPDTHVDCIACKREREITDDLRASQGRTDVVPDAIRTGYSEHEGG